jgi:alpha-L-fucosidase 2
VEHRIWWDDFWSQSALRLPDPVLERLWYTETYKFGAATRSDTPPITLQGPWTADNGKIPPWKGDYHHDLNTQLSYWPSYAGNHLDGESGFLNWLWETKPNAEAWTRRFFERPGLNVPMTADLNNEQIGGWHPYTHSATTGAWLAHHFYLHWRYSFDRAFLRDRAWPWLHETAVFLEEITEVGSDGIRRLPLSSSPEINGNRLTAWFDGTSNYDLALMRWTFDKTAELAEELGHAEEATHWQEIAGELPSLALDDENGKLLVAPDYPLQESHRHFSHLMAIQPLGLITWEDGPEAQRIIAASLADLDRLGSSLWTGYSFSWLGNLRARARDGEGAAEALRIFTEAFCLRNGFHVNGDQSGKGYSSMTYRPFTLEGNFAAAAGVQEMLIQSYSGRIVLFPAIPETWANVSFETLRTEGAYLVSADRRCGKIAWVKIYSEKGGLCRLENPFDGEPFEMRGIAPGAVRSEGGVITLEMRAGQEVLVQSLP